MLQSEASVTRNFMKLKNKDKRKKKSVTMTSVVDLAPQFRNSRPGTLYNTENTTYDTA